jgi:hypothetical protein
MSYNISPRRYEFDYVELGTIRTCRHCHEPVRLVCDIEGLWISCEGGEECFGSSGDEQLRSHAPMYKRYEYCDCHDDCDNVVGYTYA